MSWLPRRKSTAPDAPTDARKLAELERRVEELEGDNHALMTRIEEIEQVLGNILNPKTIAGG